MNARAQPDDTAAWARARDGDADAFGELFERHCDRVYNFAARLTGSWADADDIVSVVFLEAWRQRDRIVLCHGSLRPWLLGTARNVVRRRWRTAARGGRAFALLRSRTARDEEFTDDIDAKLDAQRRLDEVLHQVAALPEVQREVLILSAWEGLTYEEIAVALRLPIGTVRSRLSRARAALDAGDTDGTETPVRACLDQQNAAPGTLRNQE